VADNVKGEGPGCPKTDPLRGEQFVRLLRLNTSSWREVQKARWLEVGGGGPFFTKNVRECGGRGFCRALVYKLP